ncbi:MAG: amidase family protein [Pseudomonadota bacterium]
MEQWRKLSATQLGAAIGAGEIDPVDLTNFFLETIAAHPLTPRIYADVTADRARIEAKAAQARAQSGRRLSALDGVPVSWKDLFDSAGSPTEAGSALLEGRVPDKDAVVLERATALGLVCLGKTHMSELAFSGLGLNPVMATPPCVNDPDAVSGGSSSGAAASVAFGLAAAAIGSDTGGSVRIPSAWNDLVGFKPSHGALSLEGVVPLCPSFDTVGPLVRSVEDAAHLYTMMEGADEIDLSQASLEGTRFLLLTTVALDDLEDAPKRSFEGSVARLKKAGAHVVESPVEDVAYALDQSGVLFASEAYAIWGDTIEANADKMYAPIRERFRGGKDVLATDYVNGWRAVNCARRGYLEKTAGYDAVILPSAPTLPPNQKRLMEDEDYYVRANLLALRNTRIGNLLGLAALTLPCELPSTGISFMVPAGQEAALLRLGAAAETVLRA